MPIISLLARKRRADCRARASIGIYADVPQALDGSAQRSANLIAPARLVARPSPLLRARRFHDGCHRKQDGEIKRSERREEDEDQWPEIGVLAEGIEAPEHGGDRQQQRRQRGDPPPALEADHRHGLKHKVRRDGEETTSARKAPTLSPNTSPPHQWFSYGFHSAGVAVGLARGTAWQRHALSDHRGAADGAGVEAEVTRRRRRLPSINQTLNLVIIESRKETRETADGLRARQHPATGTAAPDQGSQARGLRRDLSRQRRRARAWPDARSSPTRSKTSTPATSW